MQHRSLTLVECLLASVILAFAVLAVSQAVVAGQLQTADALHRARALELAEALMDEVVRLPFTPTGGDVGRTTFNNAEDFNGFTEAAGALSDIDGTAYGSSFQAFSRSVSVVPAGGGAGISVTGFGSALPGLSITVTVQDTAGATWTLRRFKAQPPS